MGPGRVAIVLVLAGAAGCSPPSPPADDAVLVTIDTWRADRFGAGGHPRVRTPHLDRFFRGSTQFCDAFSPVPTTLASHASLLSGEWPTGHGVPRNGWPVPAEVVTLGEILRPHGFSTAAFVSSAALDRAFGLDQGFDVYDFEPAREVERDQSWRPADETLARAVRWWDAASGRRLLWVHLFEPHFPYDPAAVDFALYDTGYRGGANGSMDFLFAAWEDPALLDGGGSAHLEALYHAEITGLDRALGRFLARLEEEERTIVVVTSDHGESLGEHGLHFKHGPHVFAGDVAVPLAVRGPGFGSALSDALVRTIDVPRTVLERLGVEADLPDGAGSLATSARDRPAYAEASMPWNVEEEGAYANARKQRAIRTRDWTCVVTPWRDETLWFDRRRDPGELEPRPAPDGHVAQELLRDLSEWIGRGRHRAPPTAVDPALLERLRAIGYVN
ncbi:MAG: sulfatase [bacterium]